MNKVEDIKYAVEMAVCALGAPLALRPLEQDGAIIGAVGRWRHGDAIYERPASSCFQLIMNVSGGHVVDQIAPGISRSARVKEGSVGMLAPDRASTLRVLGKADVVVMFLDPERIVFHASADCEPPTDSFELSLLNFHSALTRALVAFNLSQRLAADAFAVAATEATRGIALHRAIAGSRQRRGGLPPHIRRGVESAIQNWLDGADGPPPGLRALSDLAGLSPSHFLRSFSHETGETPGKAIQTRRIRQALGLLLGSSVPVSEIAESLGYSSPSHFIDAFKRSVGATPGAVRAAANEQ